jgi:predicted DsbA family dithiol-disulfide isomerase
MLVEIWSDIACPWCYVGRARFATALATFEHRDAVTVVWRSFELDPDAPPQREGSHAERIARKYGRTLEEVAEMDAQLTATAAAEGLAIDFSQVRSGSTFDAHRLVHLAAEHGVQDAMKERLMRAYLTDGELMSDGETLVRLAGEVGLPEDDVRALLAGDRFAAAVREDERTGASLGIRGVPFFVVDRQFGASGAQPPEALGELLQHAWEARPKIEVVTTGDSCGIDGC